VPPVADIAHPAYADPWIPFGQEDVVMVSVPCVPPPLTLTVAVAVDEPDELLAVSA
jgi:hypothetical protein